MDYCVRDATLNDMAEVRDRNGDTIQVKIHEAYKILEEMYSSLKDFEQIVTGEVEKEEKTRQAGCLREESALMVGLAYECLGKLNRIRNNVC